MDDQICHAGGYGGRPDTSPDDPPDADRREVNCRLGVGGNSQFRTHDEGLEGLVEAEVLKESGEVG